VLEESRRILSRANQTGVTLRLVGGVAVRFVSPSATKEPLRRSYRDADFVGRASETKELKALFASMRYAPRETFNAMQGGRRLIFNDLGNNRRVDIFQDFFEMCHKFDLRERLTIREETLPLADLLETKLQIVQMNDKDYRDILALLIDHELGDTDDRDSINSAHVVRLCSENWGIYKTFTGSLEKVIGNLDAYPLEKADRDAAENRAQALLGAIEAMPKTTRWKIRARVGEKVAWYETPESDVAVVDSRF
jgi:hypothetical protein